MTDRYTYSLKSVTKLVDSTNDNQVTTDRIRLPTVREDVGPTYDVIAVIQFLPSFHLFLIDMISVLLDLEKTAVDLI